MPTSSFEPTFDPDKNLFDPERMGFKKIGIGPIGTPIWESGEFEIYEGHDEMLYIQAEDDYIYSGIRLTHSTVLAILRANGFEEEDA